MDFKQIIGIAGGTAALALLFAASYAVITLKYQEKQAEKKNKNEKCARIAGKTGIKGGGGC